MHSSAPAGRFFYCISFLVSGLVAYWLAGRILGLGPGWLESKWTPVETAAVGAILLVSFIGGLLGFALGMKVPAGSRNLTRLTLILWHFLANGQLVCFFAVGIAWKRGHEQLNMQEALHIFGLFAAATFISGVVLFLLGQFRENAAPVPFLWIMMVVPPLVWVGLNVRKTIHLDQTGAIIFGCVAGLAIVFLSGRMIQRDYRQMKEVDELVAKQ